MRTRANIRVPDVVESGGASSASRGNPGGNMSAVCAIHRDLRSETLSSVAARFKGRTVRLCSGGPLMTVNQVVPTAFGPQLSCAWFESPGSTKLVRAVFSTDAVQFASA
ncbi:DUF2158 domain-containing protein [Paraburkholderia guartelaensis]|uniref:DUF2158 domain-containing protein n=1 Tax=Paraburkholderia guartelaensis TaxID=2546446 RepID=A0A4R5L3B7_9BURK|nr:DUF2158 domain-containing protein [Paraburkholderia guartelaensis]